MLEAKKPSSASAGSLALAFSQLGMPCPLCGRDGCACNARTSARTRPRISFPYDHEPELVDPETVDSSEQQFEDSLMSSPVPEYRSIQLGPEREITSENASMPDASEDIAASSGIERHETEVRSLDQQAENWRDEISSRLDNYAKRRGRKRLSGEYSMQLDFERPRRSNIATAQALAPLAEEELFAADPAISAPVATAPASDEVPEPEISSPVRMADIAVSSELRAQPEPAQAAAPVVHERPHRRTQHRVIEFPRLFPIERRETPSDELAEALDKPRILDVPEETDQIVLPLADLSLEMQPVAPDMEPRDFEVPIQVCPVSQRVFAALADCTIILFATALFAGIALNMAKGLPHNKLTLAVGILVPAVLWSVYQYLFLVHAARTPGMIAARLRLATFTGEPTDRQTRRGRALGLVLSLVSAGMGFGWALVDEDTLCWHDRISRTYLTHQQ